MFPKNPGLHRYTLVWETTQATVQNTLKTKDYGDPTPYLSLPDPHFRLNISIPGEHMVHNALAGIAVGYALGMNDNEIKAGIEALKPLPGRNHLIDTETYTIIDDCYNANPISTKASLDVLAKAETRTVAILGDMGELGEQEKQMHYDDRRAYRFMRNQRSDCIGTLSSELSRGAAEAAASSGNTIEIHHYKDKSAFFFRHGSILKGDTILVKASHAMEFDKIVEMLEK